MQRLLAPFLKAEPERDLLQKLELYLELLLRWNARTNLTAVRDEKGIVERHFGESLAVAELLAERIDLNNKVLCDFGSGAGFPGIPIALTHSAPDVTLIESQNKKATFLREVVRALSLSKCTVYPGRAEALRAEADIVTMRAVDRTGDMLAVAKSLLVPRGTFVIMVGNNQTVNLSDLLNTLGFEQIEPVTTRNNVKLLIARRG